MANVVVAFHFHHQIHSSLVLPGDTTTGTSNYLLVFQFQNHHSKAAIRFRKHNYLFSSTHFSRALSICRSRLWDSNAESCDDDEDETNFDIAMEALEDYIDSIWILKVFGSYGWMLPVILISLLAATGLKAFLLTMALAILQSTFTFAFQRMQGERKNKPRFKKKKASETKKGTSRAYPSRTLKREEEAIWDDNLKARKQKKGYGSWVSSKESKTDLGGWDELDAGIMDANVRPSRKQEQKPSDLRGSPTKKSRTSRRRGGNDTPFLLRLLVSIFPFFEFLE